MSDARIDRLEQEVRSLRRALYGMAVLSLALGSAVVASCSKSAAPPTKLVFTDGKGGEVTVDASGMTVKDEEHFISISGGTVSAGHLQVRTHGKDTGGSVEIAPDQVSLHTGPALVTLYVSKETGARIQMADDDSHADITTKDDVASFALRTPHGKIGMETNADVSAVNTDFDKGGRASISASKSDGCAMLDRRRPAAEKALPGDQWTTCAPPQKP